MSDVTEGKQEEWIEDDKPAWDRRKIRVEHEVGESIEGCNEAIGLLSISEGIKYDNDKPRYSLIPQDALHEVVKVLTYGAKKYDDHNWKKLDNLQSRYKDAAGRHEYLLTQSDFDEETGLHHLAHKICCDLFRLQNKIDEAQE